MISNSKLTKEQKTLRKTHRAALIKALGAIVTSENGRVTVAFMPEFKGSRMVSVGVSIASPREQKLRPKVGEFHALDNLMFGNCIVVPDGTDMGVLAEVISDKVN